MPAGGSLGTAVFPDRRSRSQSRSRAATGPYLGQLLTEQGPRV